MSRHQISLYRLPPHSRLQRIHPHKAGQQVTNIHKWILAVISWLYLPVSAHQLKTFFDYLMYFFLSQLKVHFAFWCVWVDLLSSGSGHHSCEQYCAVHSRPDSPMSLSRAKRELIKELCTLSANHRGLFKVCTCSTASYIFNEGKLLHLFQVNGSSAPLVVKISTEWGRNTSYH